MLLTQGFTKIEISNSHQFLRPKQLESKTRTKNFLFFQNISKNIIEI